MEQSFHFANLPLFFHLVSSYTLPVCPFILLSICVKTKLSCLVEKICFVSSYEHGEDSLILLFTKNVISRLDSSQEKLSIAQPSNREERCYCDGVDSKNLCSSFAVVLHCFVLVVVHIDM